MGMTIGEAARRTGRDKSTLRRQIRAGKLSATRDHNGTWLIEPCELERLHPLHPEADTTAAPRDAPACNSTDALVAELRAVIADLRSDRDHWREQAQRLALPAPRRAPWWRWRTG
jgi:excisionase family DNA binding protein